MFFFLYFFAPRIIARAVELGNFSGCSFLPAPCFILEAVKNYSHNFWPLTRLARLRRLSRQAVLPRRLHSALCWLFSTPVYFSPLNAYFKLLCQGVAVGNWNCAFLAYWEIYLLNFSCRQRLLLLLFVQLIKKFPPFFCVVLAFWRFSPAKDLEASSSQCNLVFENMQLIQQSCAHKSMQSSMQKHIK